MNISANGILFLKNLEGLSLQPYIDDDSSTPGIEYSIGYGHQIKPDELYLMAGITEDKARELLVKDLSKYINSVNNSLHVPVSQNMFDALVSYAYNTSGGQNLDDRALFKAINGGLSSEAIKNTWNQFWITPSVLIGRRKKESDLALNGILAPAASIAMSSPPLIPVALSIILLYKLLN